MIRLVYYRIYIINYTVPFVIVCTRRQDFLGLLSDQSTICSHFRQVSKRECSVPFYLVVTNYAALMTQGKTMSDSMKQNKSIIFIVVVEVERSLNSCNGSHSSEMPPHTMINLLSKTSLPSSWFFSRRSTVYLYPFSLS